MSHQYGKPLEIKRANTNGSFGGYGSVFGNVDNGGDIVLPGAFAESLKVREPAMLWMHDPSSVVGKYDSAAEDDTGLYVEGRFADTGLGGDTRKLVQMEAVTGLSIGYRPTDVDFDKAGNRLIKQADLFEVSLVPMPMNESARVDFVKSATAGSEREFEYVLRDAGVSRSLAKTVVQGVYGQRDADDDGDDSDVWLRIKRDIAMQKVEQSLRKFSA